MLGINAVHGESVTQVRGQQNQNPAAASVEERSLASDAVSAKVNLQGQVDGEMGASSGVHLDASSAKQYAAEIAALFSSKGMGLQGHLSGFDAARLLA